MKNLKIAILYSDAKEEYFPTHQAYLTEVETKQRAQDISQCLSKMNIDSAIFSGNDKLTNELEKFKPHFAINLVDSIYGQDYLCASIPGTLELLRIPYSGTGMIGQSINSNKFFTKNILELWGITIPKYQLVKEKNDPINPSLNFPLISKLNEIHGSLEMDKTAVSLDPTSLQKRLKFLIDTYRQPVIVEEFISGREITVIAVEGSNTKLYAAEKVFTSTTPNPYQIVTFDINWNENIRPENSFRYEKYELPETVKTQVKTAMEVLKMEDYAKFDLRLDSAGRHYFIDANSNPAIGPKGCAISSILELYHISFQEILGRIIKNTLNGQTKDFNLPTII
jgi:D-alanine-D-alanine ligase